MEKVTYVSCDEIRRMFNQGKYLDRASNGEFRIIKRKDAPSDPQFNQPPGTRSQLLLYFDKATGEKIAEVHQFLKPDGGLGGSGKPDPKFLLHEGVVYRASKFK